MRVDDVAGIIRQAPADIARHVIGCRITRETRINNALPDVAGNICQALLQGVLLKEIGDTGVVQMGSSLSSYRNNTAEEGGGVTAVFDVWPGGYYSSLHRVPFNSRARQLTHFEPSSLELNGTL